MPKVSSTGKCIGVIKLDTLCILANYRHLLNPLPDNKILGLPKLKAFADNKSNVTQKLKLCFIG